MSTEDPRANGKAESHDPRDLLPENSILSFEDYMAMQRTIGNETRFRILYTLKEAGDMSATALEAALDLRANNLHYHLAKLVDVGLVQNRKQKSPDSDGLYSYYRATSLGNAILEHGVEELMRREWEFREHYGG